MGRVKKSKTKEDPPQEDPPHDDIIFSADDPLAPKGDKELAELYYSPKGYWRGSRAVTKLHEATGRPKKKILEWLEKQPIYQIYKPPPIRKHVLYKTGQATRWQKDLESYMKEAH